MLRIITAMHGGGKTTFITGKLNTGVTKTYFLVPEQNHFNTERRLYKELGAEHAAKINITSFTKLSKEILNLYNQKKPYADEAVKEVIMQKTLRRLNPVYYNNSQSALGLIAEFQKQGISSYELKSAAQSMNAALGTKLIELADIYKAYSDALALTFGDKLDDVKNAASLAKLNGFFSGAFVFADGFDGFTGSQMLLLEVIMMQGDLTLTLPYADESGYIYNRRLLERLKLNARKAGIKITQTALPNSGRMPSETVLMTAPDVYTECDFIAASIRELVVKKGYKLSDIAVISPNRALLPILSASFDVYGLNAFTDIPESIIEKPPVRFILTALEAAQFKEGAVISYIKSGFVRIRIKKDKNNGEYISCDKSRRLSAFEINGLVNAQEIWRLTSEDWKNPFPENNKTLSALEPLRNAVVQPLTDLSGKLCGSSGDKITEALADFLINVLEVPATITGLINRSATGFEKGFEIDSELNDEYRRLWDSVITVFESMHAALKDYEIGISEYSDILRIVFGKTKTAGTPQVIDAVTIGDTERTQTENIKVLFVAGANRGVFPRSLKTEGEFSADELDTILSAGIELFDDRRGRYYRERYAVNRVLCIPSELLYISASYSSPSYERIEISPLFDEQSKLKGIQIHNTADLPLELWASTKRAAKLFYAHGAVSGEQRKIIGDFLKSEGEAEYTAKIDNLHESKLKKDRYKYKISQQNASGLLTRKKHSPSSIALLNTCRFKYFCEYGLKIKAAVAENSDEPDAMQRGNLIHYCLEGILRDYLSDFMPFLNLTRREIKEAVKKKVDEYIQDELSRGSPRTSRQERIIRTYLPHIEKNVLQIQSDMKVSDFRPAVLEKRLTVVLDGITIEGIADRIDLMKKDDGVYINIIDYKTGKNAFDFPSLYYGLGWQALLYMYTVEKDWGIASSAIYQPSGFGRFPKSAEIPPNESLTPDAEDAAANWLEWHKIKGVHFLNPANPNGAKDLDELKTALKKATGKSSQYIKIDYLTEEQRNNLTNHFIGELKNTLGELAKGNVEAVPVTSGLFSPCQYCDYRSICGNKGQIEMKEVNPEAIKKLLTGDMQ